MKNIFKKNQVVITGLAFLIAVAGYLNYNQNLEEETSAGEETVSETESANAYTYDISQNEASEEIFTDTEDNSVETASGNTTTDASVGENAGEAVLTSADPATSTQFMAELKLNREQVRSENKASLQAIIDNASLSEDQKQEAVQKLVSLTDIAEREAAAEMLLEAKGFSDTVVSITDNTADVVVNLAEISDDQRAQIEDIVLSKGGESVTDIIISPITSTDTTK